MKILILYNGNIMIYNKKSNSTNKNINFTGGFSCLILNLHVLII